MCTNCDYEAGDDDTDPAQRPRPEHSVRWRGVAAAMFAIARGGNEFTPLLLLAAAGSLLLAFGSASVPLISAGRVLCGSALGSAMAVGGSWLRRRGRTPWRT
ncbi:MULTISPECIES: hypothetical protein [Nocardia]|uniref:hypothetical protein n=1 Tax=Nocardia TaxID=1817 RepID=UPI001F0E3324|nr:MULTISPECIES: hypothetical protein [Nocardia]